MKLRISPEGKQYLIAAAYLLLPALLLICVAAVWVHLLERGCRERWYGAGPNARYVMGRGCLVEVKHGLWVPERNYKSQEPH